MGIQTTSTSNRLSIIGDYKPSVSPNVDGALHSLERLRSNNGIEVTDGATPGCVWLEHVDSTGQYTGLFLTRNDVADLAEILLDALNKAEA